ncbi:M20 family metallopeptidase [Streptomyces ovatisporus]|uniref:M20 family metallopeptidase n=1 Tax=Streptomyces ovatisporus TaxID=1128682 RepID=A0ABV9AAU5_9ACTN
MTAPARQRHGSAALLTLARTRRDAFLRDLAELVGIDSGSYSPRGVNKVAGWTGRRLKRLGFSVERIRPAVSGGRQFGDILVARRRGSLTEAEGGARILLAAHMDTVFEDGTAAQRPFEVAGRLAHGPGVSDDKGGLLAGLTALEILDEAGIDEYAELTLLATPDEEIGSPVSRPHTEAVARGVDFAFALECARENGDVVTARKGVADFRLTVTGRAAHAGIEPERGANAALTAAHLVVRLQELNGRWEGVTINVGVVRAGTRSNIVCSEAQLAVEVRAASGTAIAAVRAAIEEAAARPCVDGTTVAVEQLDMCPPMEETPASGRLYEQARRIGADLGIELGRCSTGGVGDANLISGAGVPVLDGLGPVGGADHSPLEWLDIHTVPERTALLASMVATLGDRRGH